MHHKKPRGFTAIELLTTIGIMAAISTLTVLVINPAELLKQSRDAQRVSDLAQIMNALELANLARLPLGLANTVYISLPQVGGVCPTLLPTLAAGYTYLCKSDTTYKNVDGTGWIPVDFSQSFTADSEEPLLANVAQAASPLVNLPVDPKNSADDSFFYAYMLSGRKYQLVTRFESAKYAEKMQGDGGTDDTIYETGPTLGLWALATGGNYAFGGGGGSPPSWLTSGLIAHWAFDEGSGSAVIDSTGNGNNGVLQGTPMGSHVWIPGKINGAVQPPHPMGTVSITASNSVLEIASNAFKRTVAGWVKIPATGAPYGIIILAQAEGGASLNASDCNVLGGTQLYFSANDGVNDFYIDTYGLHPSINTGTWQHIVCVVDKDANHAAIYLNGALVAQTTVPAAMGTIKGNVPRYVGNIYYSTNPVAIDDVRVYNRALSASEILELYNYAGE